LSLNDWVIYYAWSSFIYGVGLGGEFPMTATSGIENAGQSGKISHREDRLHRGRKVTGAYLMQGWGQFFNQGILVLLLLIIPHGSVNPPYSQLAVQGTYRVSLAIPAIATLWLAYFRKYKMRSASTQPATSKEGTRSEKLRHEFIEADFSLIRRSSRRRGRRLVFQQLHLLRQQTVP
jgi:MFS family permease